MLVSVLVMVSWLCEFQLGTWGKNCGARSCSVDESGWQSLIVLRHVTFRFIVAGNVMNAARAGGED